MDVNDSTPIEVLETLRGKIVWYNDRKSEVVNVKHFRNETDYTYLVQFKDGNTFEANKSVAEFEKSRLMRTLFPKRN